MVDSLHMSSLHALIADDHPIFRLGLRTILEQDRRVEQVSEAEDGHEALLCLTCAQPDISFLDISMPRKDGLQVLREALDGDPSLKIVMVTGIGDSSYVKRSMELGARGYLLKEESGHHLRKCMYAVLGGEIYISPGIGADHPESIADSTEREKLALLTPAEARVLAYLSEFLTSREIAEKLFISHRTVQNHRAHICDKLGIHGVHQLTSFASRHAIYLRSFLDDDPEK